MTTPVRSQMSGRIEAAGLDVDDILLDRLETYFNLLARWNNRINLTGFSLDRPTAQAIDRLLVEPLLIARVLGDSPAVWFDLGSGGGSPAIPIQLYKPAGHLVLVESRGRKAAFLREAVRELGLSEVEVEALRIEPLAASHPLSGHSDLVTVRAVNPSEPLILAIHQLLRSGGLAALIGSKIDYPVAIKIGFQVSPTVELPAIRSSMILLSKLPGNVSRGTSSHPARGNS